MARITAVRKVPLSCLVIGPSQVRTRGVDNKIEDLAQSIKRHGMLEPIVICPTKTSNQFEVLMGQRRLLVHRMLGRNEILAAVIDKPVDLATAKALSLAENLVRTDLDARDVIDACTALYNKYGNAREVAKETGLPYNTVLRYVKYDRLVPELQEVVDSGSAKLDLALKVQDLLSEQTSLDTDEAIELVVGLADLTATQQRRVLKAKRKSPGVAVDRLLGETAERQKPKQIVVTLEHHEHEALQKFAKVSGETQDAAARNLLIRALAQPWPASG